MSWLRRIVDPVGQAAKEVATQYYMARAAGMDHSQAIATVLAGAFPENEAIRLSIEQSFQTSSWEDTELDEAKQLAISILAERFGWPDQLSAAVRVSTKVDLAFNDGPAHLYASRAVRRQHKGTK